MRILFTSALAFGLMAGAALAGPAADKAQAHIDAIAKGDVAAITAHYDNASTLQWVGGPLDGAYTGPEKIKDVWAKFTKGQGPLEASVGNVMESANPKGSTVISNVIFQGQSPIKVRYVMTFREDKLVNEVWQIDPNL